MPSDPSELRVLQFVPTLGYGGAERIAVDLSLALQARVAAIRVASDRHREVGYLSSLEEAGIPVDQVPFPRDAPVPLIRSTAALARVMRRFDPDVVHAHNPAAGTVSALARAVTRSSGVGLVVTYHGVRPHRLGMASRVLGLCDRVVAVGPGAERQLVSHLAPERVLRIDNAVAPTTRRRPGAVRDEFSVGERALLVAVGRLAAEKDHRLLLDSLAALRARGREFVAVLVGSGPLDSPLRAQARSLHLEDAVVFAGLRPDAADILGAADVVVHTSRREGLPLVLLEAMTLGRAICAVEATGVSDLIEDGVTGRLVRTRDPGEVAAALDALLASADLRSELGAEAQRRSDANSSLVAFAEAHLAAYAAVVDERRAGRGWRRARWFSRVSRAPLG